MDRNLKIEAGATLYYVRGTFNRIVVRDGDTLRFAANRYPAGDPSGEFKGHPQSLVPAPGYMLRPYGLPDGPEFTQSQNAAYEAYQNSRDAYDYACRQCALER